MSICLTQIIEMIIMEHIEVINKKGTCLLLSDDSKTDRLNLSRETRAKIMAAIPKAKNSKKILWFNLFLDFSSAEEKSSVGLVLFSVFNTKYSFYKICIN